MERILVGESEIRQPSATNRLEAQNAEILETRTPAEFRKGRLVFQFPSSSEEAALFFPSVCVCTGPCAGHCSCGGVAIQTAGQDPDPAGA